MPRLLRALVYLRDAAAAAFVLLPSAATFLRDLVATLQSIPLCTLTLTAFRRRALALLGRDATDSSASADGSNGSPDGDLIVRLEDNDPRLTELKLWHNVLLEDNDPREALEVLNMKDLNQAETRRLGRAIGRSTHLNKLSLCACDLDMAGLCDGLKDNESIEDLDLSRLSLSDADMASLAPCFSQNPSLRDITIVECDVGPNDVNLGILSDVLSSRKEPLHTLILCEILADDEPIKMDQLLRGLEKNRELHMLCLYSCDIGLAGCVSLVGLLENPASCLRYFGLSDNSICDEGARILVASLRRNTEIRALDLAHGKQIGNQGLGEMLDVVCKGTSVGSIRSSNNTLTSVTGGQDPTADGAFMVDIVDVLGVRGASLLLASLKLNKQEDKAFVAQRKMLWCHAHGLLNLGTSPEVKDVSIPTILSSFGDPSDDTIAKLFEYQDLLLPGDEDHNDHNNHGDNGDGDDEDDDDKDNNGDDDDDSRVDTIRLDSVYRIIRSRPNLCSRAEVSARSD